MTSPIRAYRSPDNRFKTAYFERNGAQRFCLAEDTMKGALLTEFSKSGKIIDQIYYKNRKAGDILKEYLGEEIVIEYVKEYERVRVAAECKKCNKEKIVREMDLANAAYIADVPVIPIFRCINCGERFYGMSNEYLNALVQRNAELFEKDEVEELKRDYDRFVNTLNEYVIRIFASKKITRLIVKE